MLTALTQTCTLGLLFSAVMCAQGHVPCPLATANNGDRVMLRGEAVHGAHDGLIRMAGCTDDVLLAYADDPSLGESKLSLKRDEMFERFVQYFNAEEQPQPNVACRECWRYRVTAEFTGRLDIAESAGWKKDAKTGKPTGLVGFGHPVPFTRYRLVLTSVSKVEAVEKKPEGCEPLYVVAPRYPTLAFQSRVGGRVSVEVMVTDSGAVESVVFYEGDRIFQGASEEAAKAWIFQPRRLPNRRCTLIFVYKIMPENTPVEEITTRFVPPLQVEVRRETASPTVLVDPAPDPPRTGLPNRMQN